MADRDRGYDDNDEHDERDDDRRGGRGGRRGGPGGGRRWGRRSRSYYTDAMKRVKILDYRDVESLRSFVTERGRIRPRRQTGLSAKEQHRVTRAIKRARHMGLLSYIGGSPEEN